MRIRLIMVMAVLLAVADATFSSQVGFWQFDGNMTDSVGSYDGTYYYGGATSTATYVTGRDGSANGAISITGGTNEYVLANLSGSGATLSGITLAGWFNTQSSVGGWTSWFGVDAREFRTEIVADGGAADGRPQVFAARDTGNPSDQGISFRPEVGMPYLPGDGWHHIAVTGDYATGQCILYIDGDWVGTAPTVWMGTESINGLKIGNGYGWNTQATTAYVDDFGIWNTALSAAEIKALVPEPTTCILFFTGVAAIMIRKKK
jgi:hypothetical protein